MRASSSIRPARSSLVTALLIFPLPPDFDTDHCSSPCSGDLREMRDAEHLALLAEFLQRAPDRFRHRAANS